jgi:putative ABC transport system permease protein
MLSNYNITTSLKLAAINPEKEKEVTPLLTDRVKTGEFLKKGQIILPDLITKGMKIKTGQDIVIIANNVDGSVNGQPFNVSGIIESVVGPTGKYGYVHIDDAKTLLRMENYNISEIALRLKNIDDLEKCVEQLKTKFADFKNDKGKPLFEIHSWKKLTPFYNIAKMIDYL